MHGRRMAAAEQPGGDFEGHRVILHGLARLPDLNGGSGIAVAYKAPGPHEEEPTSKGLGRYQVMLDGTESPRTVLVRPENLRQVQAALPLGERGARG